MQSMHMLMIYLKGVKMKSKLFFVFFLCFFSKVIFANEIVSKKSIVGDVSTGDSYFKMTVNDWSAYITNNEEQKTLKVFNEENKKYFATEVNQNVNDESEVINIENIKLCDSQKYIVITVRTFLSCESCEPANYIYERYIFNINTDDVKYLFDDESKKAAGELPLRFVKKIDEILKCK